MIRPLGPASDERYSGYRRGLVRAGLGPDPDLVEAIRRPADDSEPRLGGYDEMQRLLARREPPTAVFAGNDHLALGACWAATRAACESPRTSVWWGSTGSG